MVAKYLMYESILRSCRHLRSSLLVWSCWPSHMPNTEPPSATTVKTNGNQLAIEFPRGRDYQRSNPEAGKKRKALLRVRAASRVGRSVPGIGGGRSSRRVIQNPLRGVTRRIPDW